MPQIAKTSSGLAQTAGITALAFSLLAMPGFAQTTSVDAASAEVPAAGSAAAQPDEIVVTGIRGSLAKTIQVKRDASVVLDSINATELGRFPDADVADSLQHINGITITRTTGGEGQYVNIRGLGSQYNIVTLNDRILATDDDGRNFAFDILPAELISGADVLKSTEALALEGSIGGTVNLRSAHPFDFHEPQLSLRAEGNYNDLSQYGGFKVSGFASKTNSGRTLGVLVGVVYSDTKTRTDALNYETYDPNNPGVYPFAQHQGDPVPAGAQPVTALCCLSLGSVVDEKQRFAATGAIEWQPSPRLHLLFDALYTRLHDPQQAYDQGYYPDFSYDQNGNAEWSNVTVKNGYITNFTASNFTPEVVNQRINRVVDTYVFGGNGKWDATDHLSFRADVYTSRANRPEGGTDAFVTAGLVSPTPYNQDTITFGANPGTLPDIKVTLPGGADYGQSLANGQLNTQSAWSTHYVGLSGYSIRDTITGAKVDGSLKFGNGFFRHLDFGVDYTSRSKSRRDVSNDWTNGSSEYSSFYNTLPGQPGPITFATLGQNVISTFNFPNYFSNSGGNFPRTSVLLNIDNLLAGLKTLNGTPNYTTGVGTYDFANVLPQFNAINSYVVNEDTIAGYAELSFAARRWSGNVGVRIVDTHTRASTAVDNIISVTNPDTANPTNPGTVVLSPPTPTSASGNYLFPLPSINLSYRPTETLQFRAAGARVIARPDLNQLAPTTQNNALNNVYTLTYSGNASLKPIQAWQVDGSAEWYYRPKALLSFAVFSKWLRNDITTIQLNNVDIGAVGCFNGQPCAPLPFSVIEPINGDTSTVYGIELGWQHILPSGFGIRAQFTHTWSQTVVAGQNAGPAAGVAPTTFSINPFYEHGKVSLSVNWDHQSSFVYATYTEITGVSADATSYDWVTASASYDLTKRIRVYAEGRNLSNSIVRTYLGGNPYAVWASGALGSGTGSSVGQGYTSYGRTILGGVRLSF